MPSKEYVFRELCSILLDYFESDFLDKCAQWGLEQYALLERHNKILASGGASDNGHFIYGVAFAVIVGEFGQRAFNDKFFDEVEIELEPLGLDFRDIESYVEEDMSAGRRGQLRRYNVVDLQDIWSALCEWKRHIHKSLTEIHAEQGEGNSDEIIFLSLEKVFEPVTANFVGRMTAYSYVDSGFSN